MKQGIFKCSWCPKEKIWEETEQIRTKHWPQETLPVNMEHIVEFELDLHIEPKHGLMSTADMDAGLRRDMTGIVVDYDRYMDTKYASRMRFSFAHEVGHFFIHKEIYAEIGFVSTDEWKDFIQGVPDREYRSCEWQANEFAGRLLVPRHVLKPEIERLYNKIREENLIEYISKDPDAVLVRISPALCRIFGVSEEVIERRLEREDLWPPDWIE
ncbi:MAG: ImmA/IrrE family metallo-endopeptidase [Syntrophales bacterium]|nr:ImmA/IrrE family metallo-endopeptidase [Syntrophales bacterium]